MHKTTTLLIVALVPVLLAGCAANTATWQHEAGGTRGAWHDAYNACARDVPVRHASSVIPRETQAPVSANGVMRAQPRTGETRPEFVACMADHGWQLST